MSKELLIKSLEIIDGLRRNYNELVREIYYVYCDVNNFDEGDVQGWSVKNKHLEIYCIDTSSDQVGCFTQQLSQSTVLKYYDQAISNINQRNATVPVDYFGDYDDLLANITDEEFGWGVDHSDQSNQ